MHLLRHLNAAVWPGRAALLLSLVLVASCAARLEGPASPAESRSVALLEHGRHSSLLLTRSDTTRVRFAYGDWAWYVQEDTGAASAVLALLQDSPAGLGRQALGPAQPGRALNQDVGLEIKRVYHFEVPAVQVDRLLDRLDRQFSESEHEPYFSEARQLSFIPHSRPYRFSYNSNHMVADWLRELDVAVEGNPALGRWRPVNRGLED